MHKTFSRLIAAVCLAAASLAPAHALSFADAALHEAFKLTSAPHHHDSERATRAPAATTRMSVTHGTPNVACAQFQIYGYPATAQPVTQRAYFTCRAGYAGMYDPTPKNPLWIAEHLVKGQLAGGAKRNGIEFAEDSQIPGSAQAHLLDYRGSGFDRGHQAPAGDFTTSMTAMEQSFLLTNMVPQEPSHNRGIWANLEGAVREMADRRGELYVVTGPVYSSADGYLKRRVRIPAALYKVLVDPVRKEMTAFIIPNRTGQGEDPARFQVSVREVEKATGLDFNPVLARAEADRLEVGGGNWLVPKVRVKFRD